MVIETVLLLVALALIFSFLQSPSYTSGVEILTEVNTASESVLGSFFSAALFDPDRYIKTQAEIIKTNNVATGVYNRLTEEYETMRREREITGENINVPESVPPISQLISMVSVKQNEKTNTFEIIVTYSNRYMARDIAQAYAEEYINNRQMAAIKQISEARKEVWNRIQELEDQIDRVAQSINQYAGGRVPAELQAEGERAINLWVSFYEKYMTLRISEALEQRGLEIIENAQAGTRVGPRPVRNAALAFMVGLLVGIALAFLWEYLDDTLKTQEDFEKYYGATILGEIPYIFTEDAVEYEILYLSRPNLPAAEGYRSLRTNIQFVNIERKIKSILVTSASPGEGKTTVLLNLAASLSEMGKKVIVMEADLRRPVMEKFFKTEGRKGLTSVLMETCSLEEALYQTDYPRLQVLFSGPKPPNPAELISSQRMEDLIEQLTEMADYLLIDSPPILATSDALAISNKVDGILLVAYYGTASRDTAKRAADQLNRLKANVIGVVINNVQAAERYGYYHYYYYHAPEKEALPEGKSRISTLMKQMLVKKKYPKP